MAANVNPIFVLTPNVGTASVNTANATRNLSTTTDAALLFTAGADGSRVDTITFTHVADSQTTASVACIGRVWITGASGANARLLSEVVLAAVTPNTNTTIGQSQTITYANGLFLKSGQFLWCAISVSQSGAGSAYNVVARGGDY